MNWSAKNKQIVLTNDKSEKMGVLLRVKVPITELESEKDRIKGLESPSGAQAPFIKKNTGSLWRFTIW